MKTSKIFRYLLALVLFFTVVKNVNAVSVTYELRSNGSLVAVSGTNPAGVSATFSGFTPYPSASNIQEYYVAKGQTGIISFSNFDYVIKSITVKSKFYGVDHIYENTIGQISVNENAGGYYVQYNKTSTSTIDIPVNLYGEISKLSSISVNTEAGSNKSIRVNSITIEYVIPLIEKTENPSIELGDIKNIKDFLKIDYNGNKLNVSEFLNENKRYSISYSSDNPNILSVGKSGDVKALSDGSANINVYLIDNQTHESISQCEVTLYVKRFFTDSNCSLKTDYSSSNIGTKRVSELNKTGDYTFEYNGVIENEGYYKIGTLQSSTNSRNYRVGFQTMKLLSACPYTKVEVDYDFKIDVSASISNAPAHGAELFVAVPRFSTQMEAYEQIQLQTSETSTLSSTNYTLRRVVSSNGSPASSDPINKKVTIDNSNNENSNDFYFAMMAFTLRNPNNVNFTQSANFWYKPNSSSVTYYAYVKYDKNDGTNTQTPEEVTITSTDKTTEVKLPECGFSLDREAEGKVFVGWNTKADGTGDSFYDVFNPYDPSTHGGRGHITLYAIWYDISYSNVIFNYNHKSPQRQETVSGYQFYSPTHNTLNGVTALSGVTITTPILEDYIFNGWCDKEINGDFVYNEKGEAVEGKYWIKRDGQLVWNSRDVDVRLYPAWVKDATIVDVEVIRNKNYEGNNVFHRYVGVTLYGMTSVSNFKGKGYITVDGVNFLSTKENGLADQMLSVGLEEAPVWTFEEENGRYIIYTDVVGEDGQTQRLYLGMKLNNMGVPKPNALGIQPDIPDMRFTIYKEKGWICYGDNDNEMYNHILYMKDDETKAWEYEDTGDNPQYKPIKLLAYGSTDSYGTLNSMNVLKAIKAKLASPGENNDYPYAYNVYNGSNAPSIDDADLCKGVLYVNMADAENIIEESSDALKTLKGATSDNCLFFMPDFYKENLGNNVVSKVTGGYESLTNLVVKDKMPFVSPYTFNTGSHSATYERENSTHWGSLYLPFSIYGADGMRFYDLYGSDDIRLAFKRNSETKIRANEPVVYNYASGNKITLSGTHVDVPAGYTEATLSVSAYASIDIKEDIDNNKTPASSNDWNFKGVRFSTYVYGNEAGSMPEADNVENSSLVYFVSGDNLKYVNHASWVQFSPFRAYLQAPAGFKARSFSLFVFDEEGATDITDIVDGNENCGDGKIYDLLGRRVKNPLKGHIYIVNGQKKQY